MKQYIIITSIFDPNEAISKFADKENFQLVVVGDQKTPQDWRYENVIYLDIDAQRDLAQVFADALPYNHYGRKMMGYLYAMIQGADVIVDTDDDNIPYENWHIPAFEGSFLSTGKDLGWVNIYKYYTDQHIWPRGLPLSYIHAKSPDFNIHSHFVNHKVGVWQSLADEDPDVDAVYRLTLNQSCFFQKKKELVLETGTITPFNSQNTAIIKELFPLLFLPSFVSFRFTDILRGIIAQPIMWQSGFKLGFYEATVIQKRNIHNYFNDFKSEVEMFLNVEHSLEAVKGVVVNQSITDNLFASYEELHRLKIVNEKELRLLEIWLTFF